jgi:hypothetical protein
LFAYEIRGIPTDPSIGTAVRTIENFKDVEVLTTYKATAWIPLFDKKTTELRERELKERKKIKQNKDKSDQELMKAIAEDLLTMTDVLKFDALSWEEKKTTNQTWIKSLLQEGNFSEDSDVGQFYLQYWTHSVKKASFICCREFSRELFFATDHSTGAEEVLTNEKGVY